MIKIRTWHKNLQEYVSASKYAIIDKNGVVGNDDLVIEQWTGLFDMNGVEIYENDIVTTPIGRGNQIVKYSVGQGSVRFVKVKQSGSRYDLGTLSTKLIVIGNINENQDLFKEE